MRRTALVIAASAAAVAPADAQPSAEIDARTAQTIVTACAAHASAKHQSETVVVVDSGGKIIAALRGDGNGSGTIDFALSKAEAAAAWGFSTEDMADVVKRVPGFAHAPHVETVFGGLPIWSADGKTRLGAIGVSGEKEQDDVDCARAGIQAAGLRATHS